MSNIKEFIKRLDKLTGDESLDELQICIDLAMDCYRSFCKGKKADETGIDKFMDHIHKEFDSIKLKLIHFAKLNELLGIAGAFDEKSASMGEREKYSLCFQICMEIASRIPTLNQKVDLKEMRMTRSFFPAEKVFALIESKREKEIIVKLDARKALKNDINYLKVWAKKFDQLEKSNLTSLVSQFEKEIYSFPRSKKDAPEQAKRIRGIISEITAIVPPVPAEPKIEPLPDFASHDIPNESKLNEPLPDSTSHDIPSESKFNEPLLDSTSHGVPNESKLNYKNTIRNNLNTLINNITYAIKILACDAKHVFQGMFFDKHQPSKEKLLETPEEKDSFRMKSVLKAGHDI